MLIQDNVANIIITIWVIKANFNNNNMSSVIVYFKNQEDMINISKFSIYYYNNKLRWTDIREQEFESLRN